MDIQIKILHLEDNELDTELLIATLKSEGISCTVHRVDQKQDYIDAITNNKYDLILSDNTLPDFDGIEALRYAKQKQPATPFIFLSGTLGEDVAIEAMRWGASDYVLKHKLPKLGLTIKRVINEYEQKKQLDLANEIIRESEEKYRVITENSADAIFVTNLQGEFVYVNSEATNLFGYTKEEFLEQKISELAPQEKLEDYTALFREVISKRRAFFDLQLRRKNGTLIPVDINAVVLPNGFIYGSCRDITIRKMAEEEILKAKERAEEMNKLKSCFLSNMSHELRTPMIAIMGFAELLQDEITDPEHIKMLDGILEGATRLNTTFHNILELSRIESSEIKLETSTFSLPEVVEESVKPLYKIASKKNLYLKTEILDNNILVDVDPVLFRNAIYQIVDNGIKFTKNGGVLIQLGTQRINEQLKAVVTVSDTGVGINSDDIQKMFGEFRQISEGLGRAFEGLGVGLNVAKRVVEMMNGEISVTSQIGRGTAISISLPLRMSDDQLKKEIAVRRRTTIIEETPLTFKDKPLLLLVEDNPLNMEVINIYLKNEYNITASQDGISALVVASQKNFDAVLMDINLGNGIDGIETMKRLRTIEHYRKIPIIAVTAYVMAGDREKFMEHGFDAYLPKPFTKEMVNKLLENVLR
ncbi:MAG: PAS/PAC sensor hybrid histidine kinase [Stygiobacter sp.]|nr:MAG: PAS/PAC sensor hybrid histidine kinase [Stygiobacter sp.]KAF0215547.1 MAG: PAS/PAC sensor hybrid histidine [Ignavibacteria bacterium]